MTKKADTTNKKMAGRSEQDAPSVLENSGVMPVAGAKVGGYRQGEPSRLGSNRKKHTRSTGIDPAKKKASGRKAVGY